MIYEKIDDRQEILEQAFPQLDPQAIRLLAAAAANETIPAEQTFFRIGDEGTKLYVMAAGKAGIYVSAGHKNEVMVNTVRAYDYFGELALWNEQTQRSATIRALTDCRALTIDRADFLHIVNNNPNLMHQLMTQIAHRLQDSDRVVIQELRRKNEALEKAYADIARQEEQRREFVTTLSHELRTPLTSVQGFLQLIQKGTLKPESLPVALTSITGNVEKLVHITNNLLVLYEMQLSTPKWETITPADLLMETLQQMERPAAAKNADISVEIAPDLPSLKVDRPGMKMALSGLIENAIKFTTGEQPKVQVRAFRNDEEMLQIDVADDGIGIQPDEQEHIFTPFYRLERQHRQHGLLFDGVGIGLSIAKFVVERHGGRVYVESRPAQGSLFSLCLPLAISAKM